MENFYKAWIRLLPQQNYFFNEKKNQLKPQFLFQFQKNLKNQENKNSMKKLQGVTENKKN